MGGGAHVYVEYRQKEASRCGATQATAAIRRGGRGGTTGAYWWPWQGLALLVAG